MSDMTGLAKLTELEQRVIDYLKRREGSIVTTARAIPRSTRRLTVQDQRRRL